MNQLAQLGRIAQQTGAYITVNGKQGYAVHTMAGIRYCTTLAAVRKIATGEWK